MSKHYEDLYPNFSRPSSDKRISQGIVKRPKYRAFSKKAYKSLKEPTRQSIDLGKSPYKAASSQHFKTNSLTGLKFKQQRTDTPSKPRLLNHSRSTGQFINSQKFQSNGKVKHASRFGNIGNDFTTGEASHEGSSTSSYLNTEIQKQPQGNLGTFQSESVGLRKYEQILMKQLQCATKQSWSSERKLSVIRHMLDLVIEHFGNCKILQIIKDEYDGIYNNELYNKNNQILKLQGQMNEMNEKYRRNDEEREDLLRKLKKFTKENLEISKILDEREASYKELQESVQKLTTVNIDNVALDENTWKFLVNDNRNYYRMVKSLKKENRALKGKEKKLVSLILALKDNGYPVEEVYDNMLQGKQKNAPPSTKDEDYNEQFEPLVHGPPITVPKPANVPQLDFQKLQKDSDTSESEDFDDSDDKWLSLEINELSG